MAPSASPIRLTVRIGGTGLSAVKIEEANGPCKRGTCGRPWGRPDRTCG